MSRCASLIGRKARRRRNTAARGRIRNGFTRSIARSPSVARFPCRSVAPMLGGSVPELPIYSESYWLDPSDIGLVSASCPYTVQSRCAREARDGIETICQNFACILDQTEVPAGIGDTGNHIDFRDGGSLCDFIERGAMLEGRSLDRVALEGGIS